jgi:hypothetical protein
MHRRIATLLLLALCASSHATDAVRLRAFPTENDVLSTRQAKELLRLARSDFDLARRHERPRYAKFQYMLYDGGTTVYHGRGYTITSVHSIAGFRRGKAYYNTGAGITLAGPITNRRLWYSEDVIGR